MPDTSKSWWTHVWPGLVADPTGKHYRRLKLALYLLIYLITHADWSTGTVHQKISTIAKTMGISPWTIRGWLRRLRKGGYVTVSWTGRTPIIQIHKWRPLPGQRAGAPLRGRSVPGRGAQPHHEEPPQTRQESLNGAENPEGGGGPNENIFTRVILRNNHVVKNFPSRSQTPNGRFKPKTREELLARDIAEGLEDQRNYRHYLAYARRYPESLLRRLLSEARAVPEREIKKSRAALFEHLLKQHAKEGTENPGH